MTPFLYLEKAFIPMRPQITFKKLSSTQILMLIPNAIAALIDLIFCIPVLGRMIKWVWNSVITLVYFLFGLVEYLLWKLNIQPVKKYRIGFVILRDKDNLPLTSEESVLPVVRKAQEIYSQAKVDILPAFPRPKKLSESGEFPESSLWVRTLDKPASAKILEVGCNLPAMLQDIGLPGTLFQYHTIGVFFESGVRRLTGYGAPVTVFVVQEIVGFAGCSLGWLSDYVTVESRHLFTTAHELGHACNLPHRKDKANLMHPASGRQRIILLTEWQIAMIRASRHITFF